MLLVDDEQLVRTGLRMILGAEPDLEVVGEAADGAQARRGGRRASTPTCVLLDLRMPVLDGIGDPATGRRRGAGRGSWC